jgi:hypothetical protein
MYQPRRLNETAVWRSHPTTFHCVTNGLMGEQTVNWRMLRSDPSSGGAAVRSGARKQGVRGFQSAHSSSQLGGDSPGPAAYGRAMVGSFDGASFRVGATVRSYIIPPAWHGLVPAVTGAGGDNGIDHNMIWLRFPYVSTFWRSHYLHPHP